MSNEIITLTADKNGWYPIDTAPTTGEFLVSEYAPTNWAYHVRHVKFNEDFHPRYRELVLKYATHWRPMIAPPDERR